MGRCYAPLPRCTPLPRYTPSSRCNPLPRYTPLLRGNPLPCHPPSCRASPVIVLHPLSRWAALYHRYDHYTAALDELGIPLRWQHFMWAAHVHHALRVSAGVRPVLYVGVSVNLVRNVAIGNGRTCLPGVSVEQHMPALAEPVKPGMAHLCPRRGEVRCLTASKRCLLDAEFPQSMQDSNRTSAPTPVLRAAHARKPRSPRKAKGRERLAKSAGWNPVLFANGARGR